MKSISAIYILCTNTCMTWHDLTCCHVGAKQPLTMLYICKCCLMLLSVSYQEEVRKKSFLQKIGPKPSLNGEVCEVLKTFPVPESSTESTETWKADPSRLNGNRCAQLIAVAMANNLEEVWISKQPILLFTYLSQYCPTLFKWWVCVCALRACRYVHLRSNNTTVASS